MAFTEKAALRNCETQSEQHKPAEVDNSNKTYEHPALIFILTLCMPHFLSNLSCFNLSSQGYSESEIRTRGRGANLPESQVMSSKLK